MPPTLNDVDGQVFETVRGLLVPQRIRFLAVEVKKQTGLFSAPVDLGDHDPGRFITYALHWQTPKREQYHLMSLRCNDPSTLLLTAQRVHLEERSGVIVPVSCTRDWSAVPDAPACPVSAPRQLHRQYAGDPVPLQLERRLHDRRLFIGGLDLQGEQRPDVDVVLNLGEEPSKWALSGQIPPGDRWVQKGEGREGMSALEIVEEANWVIERLQAGKRVLVHCSAGMNRSATLCCAVLIKLEGLTAEAALARLRQTHPWARPDPFHWLNLRWLAQESLTQG
jgi:hypothetical protein